MSTSRNLSASVDGTRFTRRNGKRRVNRSYISQVVFCCYATSTLFSPSIESARAFSSVRPLVSSFQSLHFDKTRSCRTDGFMRYSSLSPNGGNEMFSEQHDIRFVSPLLEEGYPPAVLEYESNALSKKPILLYLPGFDGTVVAPFLQFPELGTIFDVRAMTIGMSDRSTFDQVKNEVVAYILNELTESDSIAETQKATEEEVLREEETVPSGGSGRLTSLLSNMLSSNPTESSDGDKKPELSSRPVYLMGESFGGILASDVALTLLEEHGVSNLKGMVLVNPATCYDRSKLASEGPTIANLPWWLYPIGLLRLVPLFTDNYSFPQLLLLLRSKALPSVIDTPAREAYMGRVAFSLPRKLKYMPQDTLKWRLEQWLEEGCERMVTRIRDFQELGYFRTLIVAGEKDMTLPSIAEAERLSGILPKTQVHVVEGAGHASTCGSRVDLAALMRNRFSELRQGGLFRRGERARTAMKPVAAQGTGVYFGLEPRYNGEEVGLSPLLYWSEDLYRKWDTNKTKPQTNGVS